jgi:hypothetical protein
MWWLVGKFTFHSYEVMGVEYNRRKEYKGFHPHKNLNLIYSRELSSCNFELVHTLIVITIGYHSSHHSNISSHAKDAMESLVVRIGSLYYFSSISMLSEWKKLEE